MKNLIEKYNITKEELNKAIDILAKGLGNICNTTYVIAIADLLANGDIQNPN